MSFFCVLYTYHDTKNSDIHNYNLENIIQFDKKIILTIDQFYLRSFIINLCSTQSILTAILRALMKGIFPTYIHATSRGTSQGLCNKKHNWLVITCTSQTGSSSIDSRSLFLSFVVSTLAFSTTLSRCHKC